MKRLILVAALLALSSPGRADPWPAIHYAPVENLEHVDVALIDTAKNEIDLAAYVLTGWPVMQALTRAADRNVKVRIYLDGTQLAERDQSKVFHLLTRRGVEIRTKRKPSALMHLKSYQIDGRLLCTGAANFSASGLKRQDNDLIAVSLDPVRFAHVRRESPGPGGGRAEPLNPGRERAIPSSYRACSTCSRNRM